MRALVTGGLGFIGSHITDRLLSKGWSVRVVDNLQPRVHPRGFPAHLRHWEDDVEVIEGDVGDRRTWERTLAGIDVVFHQAAYQDYLPDFSTFMTTNVVSTALLYEVAVATRVPLRKVIIASSQAVYGEGLYCCPQHGEFSAGARPRAQLERGGWEVRCPRCGAPADSRPHEETHHDPYNAYAISKLAGELTALRLGYLNRIPSVALRYSITQGPRQSLYNSYSGICRIFCLRLLRGQRPLIYEDGLQKRDYVHVDDVVDANMLVLERSEADFQAFNVGGDRAVTVREYAAALTAALGKDVEALVPGEYRVGDNRHSVSSVAKLRALGWAPRRPLAEVFRDYLTWIEGFGEVGDYFTEAERQMREQGVVGRVLLT